jgi:transposase
MLNHTVRSLLCVYSGLKEQIRHMDRELIDCARKSDVCRQLMTIPGVGVLTALAFVTATTSVTYFRRTTG